mgnify:CR=1 FL=1
MFGVLIDDDWMRSRQVIRPFSSIRNAHEYLKMEGFLVIQQDGGDTYIDIYSEKWARKFGTYTAKYLLITSGLASSFARAVLISNATLGSAAKVIG